MAIFIDVFPRDDELEESQWLCLCFILPLLYIQLQCNSVGLCVCRSPSPQMEDNPQEWEVTEVGYMIHCNHCLYSFVLHRVLATI